MDVAIVGAGPAGARAAYVLATRGAQVTIFDASHPREKPCGGGVTIRAARRLPFRLDAVVEDVVDRVELRLGPALDSLPALAEEGAGPFDLVFIDADKVNTPNYFAWALAHVRPGGLIVADNVVRKGAVIDPNSTDPNVQAVRRFNERVAAEPRLSATALQTVGSKGYDGFVVAVLGGGK